MNSQPELPDIKDSKTNQTNKYILDSEPDAQVEVQDELSQKHNQKQKEPEIKVWPLAEQQETPGQNEEEKKQEDLDIMVKCKYFLFIWLTILV